ncbi:beta-xylosidase [Lachnospiraceae bacterium KM106-2]|nr:beta-xylosidase [Lachnospiraceae bacterium KM106-2]
MKYKNPVLRGMYPDPSVCKAGDKYYMVCSTFHLFPGVPLFESEDMINWRQIGHCLTRKSQLNLDGALSSGGIFAPTIRYQDGRFYMVTTNESNQKNFYVTTDNIYGEWSEPIFVDQDGIDPSLYFEDGHAYFMSTRGDDKGISCICMCEIDIASGAKKSDTKILWYGSGGRYIESPHLYKFGSYYYLVVAEGGTEYGHMVTYARSESMWGPFEEYPHNPVLTNRNLGGYALQGAGHGDIVEDVHGNWWFMHLAFRQVDKWLPYHHLGRESCLEPLTWKEDGWFTMGTEGTARLEVEASDSVSFKEQELSYHKTFSNLDWKKDWCYLRNPEFDNYQMEKDSLSLRGTKVSLFDIDSPTFLGIRQDEFDMELSCKVEAADQEAGITVYMDEKHHYDLAVEGDAVFLRYTIGCVSKEMKAVTNKGLGTTLKIKADALGYYFYMVEDEEEIFMGKADTRYVSTEVASGFTGVILGLYAVDPKEKGQWATFKEFQLSHVE